MVVEKLTACLFLVLVTVDTGITLWEMYCIENLFEEPILKQICRLFSAILNKKSFKQIFILRFYEKGRSACFTWLWASELRPKFFRFLLVFKVFIRGLHKFYVLKTLPQQAHQRYPVQTSNQSNIKPKLHFSEFNLCHGNFRLHDSQFFCWVEGRFGRWPIHIRRQVWEVS